MDAIFILISDKFFTVTGKKVFLFPHSFLNNNWKDFNIEDGGEHFHYIATSTLYKSHWLLWLIDVEQKRVFYLDPSSDYSSKEKATHDIDIAKKFIWHILEKNESADVPNCIEGWVFIQESSYKVHTGKELPLQQGENNSGIYVIMYFLYQLFENDFDFFPGDVIQIRRWVAAALMRNAPSSKYSTWLDSCRKYCQVGQVQVTVIIN